MRSLLTITAFLAVVSVTGITRAEPVEPLAAGASPIVVREAPTPVAVDHPTPRLKLSYERYSAGNIDGSAMPLEALQLDMYALSWQWLRGGFDLEAGRGHATLSGASASVKYGLVGANLGLQLPGRVTPFVEGRFAGGVLGGTLDGPLAIPGTSVTVSGVSAATWMYARGIDAGAEIYTVGRAYLSFGLGWVRTTWGRRELRRHGLEHGAAAASGSRTSPMTACSSRWASGFSEAPMGEPSRATRTGRQRSERTHVGVPQQLLARAAAFSFAPRASRVWSFGRDRRRPRETERRARDDTRAVSELLAACSVRPPASPCRAIMPDAQARSVSHAPARGRPGRRAVS